MMPRKRLYWVLFIAVYLATAIWSVPGFLVFNFGEVSFDQVLFFLTTDDGTMGTDRLVLLSALDVLVVKPLTIALAATLIVWWLVGLGLKLADAPRTTSSPSESLLEPSSTLSFWQRPRSVSIVGGLIIWALLALPLVSAYNTLEDIGGIDFFAKHDGPDQFAELYVNPPAMLDVSGQAQPVGSASDMCKPRNLILLYVESLETTFSDADYFAVDLNAPLAEVFDRKPLAIHEMAGTNPVPCWARPSVWATI